VAHAYLYLANLERLPALEQTYLHHISTNHSI
jgi:hypothetical protein